MIYREGYCPGCRAARQEAQPLNERCRVCGNMVQIEGLTPAYPPTSIPRPPSVPGPYAPVEAWNGVSYRPVRPSR